MTTRWSHFVMRLCWLVSMVACILAPSLAHGVDGNGWLKAPEDVRGLYLLGLLDGWGFVQGKGEAYRKGHPGTTPGIIENELDEMVKCHKGMPYKEAITIVEKYMKDHPESWQYPMAGIVFSALGGPCIK